MKQGQATVVTPSKRNSSIRLLRAATADCESDEASVSTTRTGDSWHRPRVAARDELRSGHGFGFSTTMAILRVVAEYSGACRAGRPVNDAHPNSPAFTNISSTVCFQDHWYGELRAIEAAVAMWPSLATEMMRR